MLLATRLMRLKAPCWVAPPDGDAARSSVIIVPAVAPVPIAELAPKEMPWRACLSLTVPA